MSKLNKEFQFHIPVELTKGKEEGEWRVKGIASTPDQDLQGEVVDQEGLDISALKAGRGLFNWDHQKGPENVLGQIDNADFIEKDGKRVLQVEGFLFKDNERSKGFYSIMNGMKKGGSPRVHMSIEGKIIKRDFMNDKKINKARIDKVALTLDPVNPYTYAELVKSLAASEKADNTPMEVPENTEEMITLSKSDLQDVIDYAINKAQNLYFEEGTIKEAPKPDLIQVPNEKETVEMTDAVKIANDMRKQLKDLQAEIVKAKKALAAGAPSGSPEGRVDGEAMSKESLDKEMKTVTYSKNDKKKKKINKALVTSIIDSLKKAHPDQDPWDLAEMVIEAFVIKNIKESHSD